MLKTICLLMTATSLAAAAEDIRQTLTSTEQGIHHESWKITNRGPKIRSATPWSVEKLTLHGGKQEGVDDLVANRGPFDQEFQFIYHLNHGPPLLEKGSRFDAEPVQAE